MDSLIVELRIKPRKWKQKLNGHCCQRKCACVHHVAILRKAPLDIAHMIHLRGCKLSQSSQESSDQPVISKSSHQPVRVHHICYLKKDSTVSVPKKFKKSKNPFSCTCQKAKYIYLPGSPSSERRVQDLKYPQNSRKHKSMRMKTKADGNCRQPKRAPHDHGFIDTVAQSMSYTQSDIQMSPHNMWECLTLTCCWGTDRSPTPLLQVRPSALWCWSLLDTAWHATYTAQKFCGHVSYTLYSSVNFSGKWKLICIGW